MKFRSIPIIRMRETMFHCEREKRKGAKSYKDERGIIIDEQNLAERGGERETERESSVNHGPGNTMEMILEIPELLGCLMVEQFVSLAQQVLSLPCLVISVDTWAASSGEYWYHILVSDGRHLSE